MWASAVNHAGGRVQTIGIAADEACYIPLNDRVRERNSVRAGISQDAPIPILALGGRAVTAGRAAEPSSDTPDGLPSDQWSHQASSLNPHQSRSRWGFFCSSRVQPRSM